MVNGAVYFRLSDVGGILNLTNAYRYDFIKKGSHTVTTLTPGGNQDVTYIDEPTLYRLIFKSRKQEAVAFQDWVFDVVLPSIRKTGKYYVPMEVRKESTEKRKELTDAWKESGIKEPLEYAMLTKAEYQGLGFPDGTKKKSMDVDQIMLLMALETFEKVNLHFNKKKGYWECMDSLMATSQKVLAIKDDTHTTPTKQVKPT